MDETSLIRAACQGDLDAFNHLVLAYQELAFNLAYRMLSDPEAAADATQTAFFSAYRALKDYRGGSFRAWILRMVANACYDELRRRKRRPTVPLEPADDFSDGTMDSPAWLADDAPTPEEALDRAELEHALRHCLGSLSPEFRLVVVMVDVQGMDYAEVAQVAGIPLGTIKSRLARARLRMQECLQAVKELLPARYRLVREGM